MSRQGERLSIPYKVLARRRGWVTTWKAGSSPLTSGDLFNIAAGRVEIAFLYGIVRTPVQAQSTTIKLTVNLDGGGASDLTSAEYDANGVAAGTELFAQHFSTAPLITSEAEVNLSYVVTSSSVISVVYGAASTGVVDWFCMWRPTPGYSGVLTAA